MNVGKYKVCHFNWLVTYLLSRLKNMKWIYWRKKNRSKAQFTQSYRNIVSLACFSLFVQIVWAWIVQFRMSAFSEILSCIILQEVVCIYGWKACAHESVTGCNNIMSWAVAHLVFYFSWLVDLDKTKQSCLKWLFFLIFKFGLLH